MQMSRIQWKEMQDNIRLLGRGGCQSRDQSMNGFLKLFIVMSCKVPSLTHEHQVWIMHESSIYGFSFIYTYCPLLVITHNAPVLRKNLIGIKQLKIL